LIALGRGSATFERFGTTLWRLVPAYYCGALAAGIVVGMLGGLVRGKFGGMIVGICAGAPAFATVAAIALPPGPHGLAPHVIAGIAVGGIAGYQGMKD
jgi:hypothetical protein